MKSKQNRIKLLKRYGGYLIKVTIFKVVIITSYEKHETRKQPESVPETRTIFKWGC